MKVFKIIFILLIVLFNNLNIVGQNWTQSQKLCDPNRSINDYFGNSIAISVDRMAVGIVFDREDEFNQNDMITAGSVLIYKLDSLENWNLEQKIVASDRQPEANFGYSCDIDGPTLVVGAMQESYDENGNNYVEDCGAAYVFELDCTGEWVQVQKLVASDRSVSDWFGRSVAISGNYLVVGADIDGEDENGLNPIWHSGSAYIFEKDSLGIWVEVQKIKASDRTTQDYFGFDVDISGDYIISGAQDHEWDEFGLDSLVGAGAAYVYHKDTNGVWNEVQKLDAADRSGSDEFGWSVAISHDKILVGAPLDAHDTLGLNYIGAAGSAYFFELDSLGVWNETDKVIATERFLLDAFGVDVAICDGFAVVGAFLEDEDANDQNTLSRSGSAYIFEYQGNGDWGQPLKIVAGDRDGFDQYGHDVAITPHFAGVGSDHDEHDTLGLNPLSDAGSAYMYPSCNTIAVDRVCTCDSFYWSTTGLTYYSTGQYSFTGTNMAGCDSTTYLNLTISNNGSYEYVESCESYYWATNGQTYTDDGVYSESFINQEGCDSTVVLDLKIHQADSVVATVSTCVSYYWYATGLVYTSSGAYSATLSNSFGCDSIVLLNLTILESSSSTISQSTCSDYQWNGSTYSSTGTYVYSTTNSMGCDSTATLNLVILEDSVVQNISSCDEYVWEVNNVTYTSSGIYSETLTNQFECDSIVVLNLVIYQVDSGIYSVDDLTLSANANGVTYQWLDCDSLMLPLAGEIDQVFTATSNGNYAVEVTQNGCIDTSACMPISNVSLSIEAIAKPELYPNPSDGKFVLGTNSLVPFSVIIYNTLGKKVLEADWVGKKEFDLNLKSGVYFLHLNFYSSMEVLKLIIHRVD